MKKKSENCILCGRRVYRQYDLGWLMVYMPKSQHSNDAHNLKKEHIGMLHKACLHAARRKLHPHEIDRFKNTNIPFGAF